MRPVLSIAVLILAACRGTVPPRGGNELTRLVDSLIPAVERAAGLAFRTTPRSASRTREEIRAYLLGKLRSEFPPERQEGVEAAYRLLGLLPDTLDLRRLLLDLYTEQVAGYYDPDSSTLYGVEGGGGVEHRLVVAHELVHALQHQYLPLDSIMKQRDDADQLAAAQAVLEGHATLASMRVLMPGEDFLARPEVWELIREQIREQQAGMRVFSTAPLVLREGLVFPYIGGAAFVRWWDSARGGRGIPRTEELPRSTEQILHPARYATGDAPVAVRFREGDGLGPPLFEDTIGELELHILAAELRGGGEVLTQAPAGWAGDRYRVYRSPAGHALVWYLAFDDPASAARFGGTSGARLAGRARDGYRTAVEPVEVAGRPGLRIVVAPVAWSGWASLPTPPPSGTAAR